jgi:hypothetical protein
MDDFYRSEQFPLTNPETCATPREIRRSSGLDAKNNGNDIRMRGKEL